MKSLIRACIQCRRERFTGQAHRMALHLSTVPMSEEDCHDKPSLTETIRPYMQHQTPAVLRGAVANASAIERWKSWDYLEKNVGCETTCHVEVGGNYAQSQRCDIRFSDYLAYLKFFEERYGRSGTEKIPNEELVYLAQNDAFEGLLQDFVVPDFCTSLGEGHLYSTMIWIGPYGCVSPLHFDPMDNALMQFVGTKRVLMYPPEVQVYAGHDGNQSNTSSFNPEEPLDIDKYPLAVDLPPSLECTLAAGDLLYIPKKWWHYIRTVETSISINCWWR